MALCCVKIQQLSKLWLNLSDLRNSKLCLMKPTPQMCSTTSRDQNPEIRSPEALPRASTCHHRFLTSRSSSGHMRHPVSLLVGWSTKPTIPAVIRPYTCPHAPQDFWSSEIGQLAYSSLWFLQRHSSRHLQVIFLYLSNLKPSSSFYLEFEGGC